MKHYPNDYEAARLLVIAALVRIDPSGTWRDKDSITEDKEPLTLKQAVDQLKTIVDRD